MISVMMGHEPSCSRPGGSVVAYSLERRQLEALCADCRGITSFITAEALICVPNSLAHWCERTSVPTIHALRALSAP